MKGFESLQYNTQHMLIHSIEMIVSETLGDFVCPCLSYPVACTLSTLDSYSQKKKEPMQRKCGKKEEENKNPSPFL